MNRLLEQFDHLLDTPESVPKLRALILDLAVRGKLVPQDPSDEPASVLLRRIEAEKRRLVKEGKIRKPKKLPPVTEEEVPFEVPEGWVWVRMGKVGIINPRNDAPDDMMASFVPMTLIEDGFGSGHKDEERTWGAIRKGYTHFANDDVGLAKITPCYQNRKSAVFRNLINGIGAGTTELHIFRPIAGTIVPELVLLFFQSSRFVDGGLALMTGTAGQQRVPKSYVEEGLFPLPPLPEQHRIVARVDELIRLCDRLEDRLAKRRTTRVRLNDAALDTLMAAEDGAFADRWRFVHDHFDLLYTDPDNVARLKQAILQLAVQGKLVPQDPNDEPASVLLRRIEAEKKRLVKERKIRKPKKLPPVTEEEVPFEVTEGWAWVRLGEVIDQRLGKMLDKRKNQGRLRPYLRNLNVQWQSFDLSDVKQMRFEDTELDEFKVRHGDILMCEGGEPGRCAIWTGDTGEYLFQKALHRIRPFAEVNPQFIVYQFLEAHLSDRLSLYFTGATIKHFTGKALSHYVFPLPPLAEQHRIVARVDELMQLCDRLAEGLEASNEKRERLLEAVLHGALDSEAAMSV